MFDAQPLSKEICKLRWLLFGHVLRMHEKTPAQIALKVSLDPTIKRRQGKPRDSLLSSLKKEVQQCLGSELSLNNFDRIKDIACDKKRWIKVFTHPENIGQN